MRRYKVVEIFQSIDGEGVRSGSLAQFVRLAGCNLNCSYCDTRYAWDASTCEVLFTMMTADEIVGALRRDIRYVTITGGEPLMADGVSELLERLTSEGFCLNIETNGAVDISPFRQTVLWPSIFTIDYKLPSSGMEKRMLMSNFFALKPSDVVKFVVGREDDIGVMLSVVEQMASHYEEMPHIYIGVVWGEFAARQVVEAMLVNPLLVNATFQLQLHKFIWDADARGV